MDQEEVAATEMGRIKLEEGDGANGTQGQDLQHTDMNNEVKQEDGSQSPKSIRDGLTPRHDGVDTPTPGKPSKLSRSSSHKTPTRSAPLYDNLPNVTTKACAAFQVIPDCLYGSKNLGSTDNDSFDCECREEWRKCILFHGMTFASRGAFGSPNSKNTVHGIEAQED